MLISLVAMVKGHRMGTNATNPRGRNTSHNVILLLGTNSWFYAVLGRFGGVPTGKIEAGVYDVYRAYW